MGASCIRWTAETERAFVFALKQTGQVQQAAAAIGRVPSVCYQRRDRSPAFAAAWETALAEMAATRLEEAKAAIGASALEQKPLTRARRDGWTQQRQRAFGRALADTGSYGQAARRVGISMTSVQRLRRRSPDFQALCDKALTEGGVSPEEAARARAVDGWDEPVFHGGKLIGHRRRYSDALLKALVAGPLEANAATPRLKRRVMEATQEDIDRELMRRLDVVAATLKKKERAAQLAWCERMAREGKAP